MAAQRMPLILAHLFAAPLVRETTTCGDDNEPVLVAVPQHNYAEERDVITSTLAEAQRGIEFSSEVASANNFLMNLTGCRVLHFTWNGDSNQEQVMFEDKKGLATLVKDEWFQNACVAKTLPEVVVLTAASAETIARAFVRAGISNVIAVKTKTGDANTAALDFVRAFYTNLAQGQTVQKSFDEAVQSVCDRERERFVLLPENGEHAVSPFDDASSTGFKDRTQRLPKLPFAAAPHFRGREIQVQEVFMYMVQPIRVITIRGKPGIGKTEVALRACEYAWERRLFGETFFVPFKDPTTGVTITALRDLAARIADAFGFSKKEICEHPEGFLGCIQHKCNSSTKDLLLVLDGCPPYLVNDKNQVVKLSSVVEHLGERGASKLKFVITVVTQVGIAREKVVNVGGLSDLDAVELFIASASREVKEEELRGGMFVCGSRSECIRLFAGSAIMAALDGHPGAIVSVSGMLQEKHLLRYEDEYLQEIDAKFRRYDAIDQDFASKLKECPCTQSGEGVLLNRTKYMALYNQEGQLLAGGCGFVIEVEWGGRQVRGRPGASPFAPAGVVRLKPSDGEFWWNRAVEKHSGESGTVAQTVSWQALRTHSLSQYFLQVLGAEGRARPLDDDDFQALANNAQLWHPFPTPGSRPGLIASRQGFLGQFWPWFKGAMGVLKSTGYWGCKMYPVICGLSTTRSDGESLLQRRPSGTFLLRVSSSILGALVIMFVKEDQQVGSILIRVPSDPAKQGRFELDYKTNQVMRGNLQHLILKIDRWTHLFPDTPKEEALRDRL